MNNPCLFQTKQKQVLQIHQTQLSLYESKAQSVLQEVASTKSLPPFQNQSLEQYEQVCLTQLGGGVSSGVQQGQGLEERFVIHGWNVSASSRSKSWISPIKSRAAAYCSLQLKEKLERLKKQTTSTNVKSSQVTRSLPATTDSNSSLKGENTECGEEKEVSTSKSEKSSNASEVDMDDDELEAEEDEEEDEDTADASGDEDGDEDDEGDDTEEIDDGKEKSMASVAKSKLNPTASTFSPKRIKTNTDQQKGGQQQSKQRVTRSQANKRKTKGGGQTGGGRGRKVARTSGNGASAGGGRVTPRRGRGRKRGGAGGAPK